MLRWLKGNSGMLTEALLFILVGLLWFYIWFVTGLWQSYY